MDTSQVGTDMEKLDALLCDMREQLAQQDTDALKKSAKALLALSKPQLTMDTLAPLILRESSDMHMQTISSSEALSIVGFLVTLTTGSSSTTTCTYLKPASRAFKRETARLTTSEHSMHVSPECLQVMVSQLSGSDVEVAANATQAMLACCRKLGPEFTQPALQAITAIWRTNLEQLDTNKSTASTICVRCATCLVQMAALDDTTMRAAVECGSTNLLVTMLTDDSDPLLQMSVLDLIEQLALAQPMHHERAVWLFREQVTNPLLQLAGGSSQEGVPDGILGGPALRMIAALCKLGHRDSTLFGLHETELIHGFHRALHNFQVSGELDRLAIVDAISSFASASQEALLLILNDPVLRQAWLSLSVAQPKLKSAILTSVAMVLDPSTEVDANGDSIVTSGISPPNPVAMKLYAAIGQTGDTETTPLVLSIAKSPLPEARLGAYTLLAAVAKLSTGGQVLFTHPGFYEWLMSRDGETTKEGREAKYAIVQAIVESPVKGLLSDEIVRKLEEYSKQGPHFVTPLSWELAVE